MDVLDGGHCDLGNVGVAGRDTGGGGTVGVPYLETEALAYKLP